ncbi:MAG: GyrI-like domain-containing protein [Paludibacteraceae bacterium]|nr:GyrI-like domain-containing protein [Paludibacteraceae bacterium]MBR6285905.1 GyrI-like domain-containing protein [Bacteroidaceae bacterium]
MFQILIIRRTHVKIVTLKGKTICGISCRTNEGAPDCSQKKSGLWQRYRLGIGDNICNKINYHTVALYSDYRNNGDYVYTLGREVSHIPGGNVLSARIIPPGRYAVFSVSAGEGTFYAEYHKTWDNIHLIDGERSFSADFEEYFDDFDGKKGTMNIYISLKE